MKLFQLALMSAIAIILGFQAAAAQDRIHFEVADAGQVTDSGEGTGLFMRIVPVPLPKDGLGSETIAEGLLAVCPQLLESVAPIVASHHNLNANAFAYIYFQIAERPTGSQPIFGRVMRLQDGQCTGEFI